VGHCCWQALDGLQAYQQALPCDNAVAADLHLASLGTALALHFPLTLWHCLAQLLPGRGWPLPAAGSTLRVAYLGEQHSCFCTAVA
jgi:hypothetical protein